MAQVSAEELEQYLSSPAHYAVAQGDYAMLRRLLARLPRLPKAGEISSELESIQAEQKADVVSSVIDSREVPGRETPLHLAVRLGNVRAVEMLVAAGADCTLENARGWSALQEAVCARKETIAMVIIKYHQTTAWAKWCRRLPRLVGALSRMRDFYMEVTFQFESSIVPFIGRIAPSDTYRIWKVGANLRADTTLAGFDGFKIKRSDRSYLFLAADDLGSGDLLVLEHKKKQVVRAFEGAEVQPTDAQAAYEVAYLSRTNVHRAGIDVTQAELVPQMTWRRHERMEMAGSWKSKVYDMHNVSVSLRTRRVLGAVDEYDDDEDEGEAVDYGNLLTEEEKRQLEMALNGESVEFEDHSESPVHREHEIREKQRWLSRGGKDKDAKKWSAKTSASKVDKSKQKSMDDDGSEKTPARKYSLGESEFRRCVRPVLWLANDFPLQTEELLPLLDILASKVKAVRRLRELLTTKLPGGTFPVKVAIPVVPTIRVVVTFSKFEDLQEHKKSHEQHNGSWFSWMRGSQAVQEAVDPFLVPADYTWKNVKVGTSSC